MKTPGLLHFKYVLTITLMVAITSLLAQNKSLGVGTTSPNPNAVLHVESPGNNQGAILPRLTTAQRTAATFTSALSSTDNGLLIYDSDLKKIFIWNGANWNESGSDLSLPITRTLSNSDLLNDGTALDITYTGDSSRTLLNLHFSNPANTQISNPFRLTHDGQGAAFVLSQTSVLGTGAIFSVTNTANPMQPFRAITSGTGQAGNFRINNISSTSAAIFTTTNGSGPGIQAQNTGSADGFAGLLSITNPSNNYPALNVTTVGGGNAGFFYVDNTASSTASLVGQTIGSGVAIQGYTTGTGSAGRFEINNASNSSPALYVPTNGTGSAIETVNTGTSGNAANFYTTSTANDSSTVYAQITSTFGSAIAPSPAAIKGISLGNSHAAQFEVKNPSSFGSAIYASSKSFWPVISAVTSNSFASIYARNDAADGEVIQATTESSGSVYAGLFQTGGGSNTRATLRVLNRGSAQGMLISNDNTGNTSPVIEIANAGTGPAINATGAIVATSFQGDGSLLTGISGLTLPFSQSTAAGTTAFDITNSGTAGYAANFANTNASNTDAALFVSTAGNANAIRSLSTGGPAAYLQILNSTSPYDALFATTNGTGNGLFVSHTGASGNIAVFQSGGLNVARIDKTGQGFFNGGTQTTGADVAEMFDVAGARNSYEPGDVLVISDLADRTVQKSDERNSTKVVGVYATRPGVILTEKGIDANLDDMVPMGVIGVIPTKVCLENGPIKRGDLLVTSSKAGHAMKAIPENINGLAFFPTGAILGKALENFDGSAQTTLIKVLVNVK